MGKFSDVFVVLIVMLGLVWNSCDGCESESESESGIFGFNMHHMLSEPVKAMLNRNNEVPEMETFDFYTAMVNRDRFFHGRRRLATEDALDPLTFSQGNTTVRLDSLGFLYYANVSVGTPESWYLVALDTGSHLFWLPCDCTPTNCLDSFELSPTQDLQFNIYSVNASSTGAQLSCSSPFCRNNLNCSSSGIHCPYKVAYLSENTSSTGYLVEDVLHLTTDNDPSTRLQAAINFGCGVVQTGAFLKSAAPNGLFGLSMATISVPSTLSRQNLTANSFSMCFNVEGLGRISFGDKGSHDQGETPINPDRLNLYNVSITQVAVGNNVSAADLAVIIDSGTSFTYLSEPAYTLFTEKFDSQMTAERLEQDPDNPFEYCYQIKSRLSNLFVPPINLTMQGGDIFSIIKPSIVLAFPNGTNIHCLAIIKSDEVDINIIGENFMSRYRVVFDQEKMVFGWKASECDEIVATAADSPPSLMVPSIPDTSSAWKHNCFIAIIVLVQILSLHSIKL